MVHLDILKQVAHVVLNGDWGGTDDCSKLYSLFCEVIHSSTTTSPGASTLTPDDVRRVWECIVVPVVMNLDLSATVAECIHLLPSLLPSLLAARVPSEHITLVSEVIPRSGLVPVMQAVVVARGFRQFAKGVDRYGHSGVWLHMLLSDLNSQVVAGEGFDAEALPPLTDSVWARLLADTHDTTPIDFGYDKVGWFSSMGKPKRQRILSPSLEHSLEAFEEITGGGLLTPLLKSGHFVVAGGSVLRSLCSQLPAEADARYNLTRAHDGRAWKGSDIDLFLVLPQEPGETVLQWHERSAACIHDAVVTLAAQINRVKKSDGFKGAVLLLTDTALTLTWAGKYGSAHKVQFVLCVRNSIAEILNSFDVDSCCVATDGERFYAPERGLRALRTGVNVIDPIHRCVPSRFAKYFDRGFECMLQVPGLYRGVVQSAKDFCSDYRGDRKAFRVWRKQGGLSALLAWNEGPLGRDPESHPPLAGSNGLYLSLENPMELLDPDFAAAVSHKHPGFVICVFGPGSGMVRMSARMRAKVVLRMHQGLMGKRNASETLLYHQ